MTVHRALSLATRADSADEAAEERGLVELAREGDGLAFRRLVEPHLALLYRIAARMTGDRASAEDAVQETLAVAFRRLGAYDPTASTSPQPFRAFLAAIAARQAHGLIRSERRRAKRQERATTPYREPGPEEMHRVARLEEAVRAALAAMPKKRREAVLLRLDAGLGHREIAEAIGSSEASVRVLVHQALAELKERLGELM
jgi:RNA polymerase sigma-70 factor, ECF subfamily